MVQISLTFLTNVYTIWIKINFLIWYSKVASDVLFIVSFFEGFDTLKIIQDE